MMVAAAVSAVLCTPQFLWMALVDRFGPIKFAEGKAESALPLFDLLWSTLKFIVNGLFYIIPVAVLFLLLIGPVDRNRPPPSARSDPFARRYLAFLAFGPLVTCVLVGLLSGRRLQSGWAELSWCFISLYLIAQWRRTGCTGHPSAFPIGERADDPVFELIASPWQEPRIDCQ